MKRKRFTEEQIIGVLKEHDLGAKTADLCRKHGHLLKMEEQIPRYGRVRTRRLKAAPGRERQAEEAAGRARKCDRWRQKAERLALPPPAPVPVPGHFATADVCGNRPRWQILRSSPTNAAESGARRSPPIPIDGRGRSSAYSVARVGFNMEMAHR
jgi:hypothetical protein